MTTISDICHNLFTETNLAELPHKPTRGSRRNLARIIYRTNRRPGLINSGEPGESQRSRQVLAGNQPRPMQHVYKFHEPPRPNPKSLVARLRRDMVPKNVNWRRPNHRVKKQHDHQ